MSYGTDVLSRRGLSAISYARKPHPQGGNYIAEKMMKLDENCACGAHFGISVDAEHVALAQHGVWRAMHPCALRPVQGPAQPPNIKDWHEALNALLFSNACVPHSGAAAQAIETVLAAGRNIAHQHPTDAPGFFAAERLIHQAFIDAEKWQRAYGPSPFTEAHTR